MVLRKSDDTYIGNIRRSSTDNAIYVGGNSYLTLGSGDTERVRIDSSGNVGIGTSSPNSKLEIYSTANEPAIRLTSTATATKTFGLVVNPSWAVGSFHIYDYTLDYSRLQVASNGNVGIGVGADSPNSKVHIVSDSRILQLQPTTSTSQFYLAFSSDNWVSNRSIIGLDNSAGNNLFASGGSAYALSIGTIDSRNIVFATANNERVRIDTSGNVGIGTTSPAAKLHVNGSTTIVGDTATTQNVRQTIVGSTTGNTSTGTITVTAIITSVDTASATATFSFANAYGNSVTPNRLSYISLNSTITSIDCSYNNSGYQMEIAVTYTGATAPTLYFTAEGMGSSIWTL